MKQALLFLMVCCLATTSLLGQSPRSGQFEFYKGIAETAPGLTTVYQASPDLIWEALATRLEPVTNRSPDKVRGDLYVYPELVIEDITPQTLDYYVRVEALNRDESQSRVTLFLSLGNDNFMDSRSYGAEFNNAGRFLNALEQDVNLQVLKLAQEEAQETLEDAESVMKDLEKDQEKLRDEQKDLEKALQENEQAQRENAQAREQQSRTLSELRATISDLERQVRQLDR